MRERSAAIVGVYEFPERRVTDLSALQIKALSAARALEDAGLGWGDVDALYDAGEAFPGMSPVMMAEYLHVNPRVLDGTAVGGSSYEFHAAHARRDIESGRARVALLTYGSTAKRDQRAIGTGGRAAWGTPTPVSNLEDPWGLTLIANYALVARRHMHQYGTRPEQLAEIAVAARHHAMRNPLAIQAMQDLGFRNVGEISVEDVLASPLIADPLHLLDCCMISDGGGAAVVASADVARQVRHRPIWILGTGEAAGYPDNGRDITVTAAARSGPAAFGQAGVKPEEMDVAMIYDSFTITVLAILEDLGFCAKGEGGDYVSGGRLAFDHPGGPALNTDGGGLSSNHPGMRGIFLLIEAVRQLRGLSTAQVDGARLAVAHGNGGQLGTRHAAATIILGRD
ncbi:thiolase C-terminal domain-containing protein [Sulfobacillus harzensis]|uniref:Thiolase C-terminal domain-containing protein n=1 Tax=Sulfobacillus harzensis TaxID=2729629 RepID=A0A7Y0Q4J4_9FIRM|nr:hypothetical protein [Sulfobacillus harzensis]NMP23314.1 hypothetical protein [Sulfobacillus harzensis]